ncbi:hypothetical protein GCM10010483_68490 [Actinokineospora diospyrosa]
MVIGHIGAPRRGFVERAGARGPDDVGEHVGDLVGAVGQAHNRTQPPYLCPGVSVERDRSRPRDPHVQTPTQPFTHTDDIRQRTGEYEPLTTANAVIHSGRALTERK